MTAVIHTKNALFRKKQQEYLKLGGIWGLLIPGLLYIDLIYKNFIIYMLYVMACYFGVKITLASRNRLKTLSAEYLLMQNLEALAQDAHVLSQVQVETGRKEAKIDWLVVSRQGIWCLKVNALAGKITGGEKEKNWSQILKPHKAKSKPQPFPNPLLTAQYEAKRLKEYLQQQLSINVAVQSLVVFTAAGSLEAGPASGAVLISSLDEVLQSKDKQVLTPETIQKIIANLQ